LAGQIALCQVGGAGAGLDRLIDDGLVDVSPEPVLMGALLSPSRIAAPLPAALAPWPWALAPLPFILAKPKERHLP